MTEVGDGDGGGEPAGLGKGALVLEVFVGDWGGG